MKSKTTSKKKSSSKKILEIARKRFDLAQEAEIEQRRLSLDDLKFRGGEQWPEAVKRERDSDARPCLTINRLPQFIRQITNDQRQNRPSIRVSPVDDNADKDTAKVLQGLIRHIEYDSNADQAFDNAFENAATYGFGFFRVITEYTNPMSFDQDIKIKRIQNPFTVYLDPTFQEADGSDANYAFIFEDMAMEDFKDAYPNSETASLSDWASIGDSAPDWLSKDAVRVAEYFYKEFEDVEIALIESEMAGPQAVEVSKLPEGFPEDQILSRRTTKICKVKWAKITANEILEEKEWAGRWIPIIPVFGDEVNIDGKKIYEGVIRHAKDPQRMFNYWKSAETEAIALAPRTPFIGAEGQFEGHEGKWANANRRNFAFLEYKPVTLDNNTPAPPPQRNSFEPAVGAITQAAMLASEDLKATTGIYDAALGNRSNETSGIAITARTSQAQTSNFHYIDNLSRALKHTGRILVDLIPKVYDTERTVRIIGEEEKEEIVKINTVFEKDGEKKNIYFSHGKYDVTVATGPSFATKRQEAVESMIALTQQAPQIGQYAIDLLVKNMDWHGSEEIAERLKKTIPPELLDEKGEGKIPPQVKAQMTQMNQMIEQLTQQLNEKTEIIDKETIKYEFEKYKADLNAELDRMKIEAGMREAFLKEEGLDSREAFKQEINQIDRQSFNQGPTPGQGMNQENSQIQQLPSAQPQGNPEGDFNV